jgi:hypothetical protein
MSLRYSQIENDQEEGEYTFCFKRTQMTCIE